MFGSQKKKEAAAKHIEGIVDFEMARAKRELKEVYDQRFSNLQKTYEDAVSRITTALTGVEDFAKKHEAWFQENTERMNFTMKERAEYLTLQKEHLEVTKGYAQTSAKALLLHTTLIGKISTAFRKTPSKKKI